MSVVPVIALFHPDLLPKYVSRDVVDTELDANLNAYEPDATSPPLFVVTPVMFSVCIVPCVPVVTRAAPVSVPIELPSLVTLAEASVEGGVVTKSSCFIITKFKHKRGAIQQWHKHSYWCIIGIDRGQH